MVMPKTCSAKMTKKRKKKNKTCMRNAKHWKSYFDREDQSIVVSFSQKIVKRKQHQQFVAERRREKTDSWPLNETAQTPDRCVGSRLRGYFVKFAVKDNRRE